MDRVYTLPQCTHKSRRAPYPAPPCNRRRRRYDQGERSRAVLLFKTGQSRTGWVRSFGTHGNRMPFARIRSTLTSSRTSCGYKTRGSSSRRGASMPPLLRFSPQCPVIETMRPVGMAPYLSWTCAQKRPNRLHTRKIRKTNCCPSYRSKGWAASHPFYTILSV